MRVTPRSLLTVAALAAISGGFALSGCTSSGSGKSDSAATNTPAPTPTMGPKWGDDMESIVTSGMAPTGWSVGMNQISGTMPNSWIVGEPTPGSGLTPVSPAAHSGLARWGTEKNNGRFYRPEDSWLLSPVFVLPAEAVKMNFWHWFEFAVGTEGLLVEARLYDPSSWTPISGWFPVGPILPCTGIVNPPTPLAGTATPWLRNALAYTGSCGTWQKVTVDLESYAGQMIRLRWHLGIPAGFGTPNRPGYYLDDVSIQ